MFTKPTPEIEAEVLAEYDADYAGFCERVFEGMERTNPGMAELFWHILQMAKQENNDDYILGLQMASAVYRQLEMSAGGSLPIVEMKPALLKAGLEVLLGSREFVNQYGTTYFYDGLIRTKTLSHFLGDALGHGADYQTMVFVAVFVIRVLEGQIELDLGTSKEKVF